MTEIRVKKNSTSEGWEFDVIVEENGEQTSHRVNLSQKVFENLIGSKACDPEGLVRKSFEFLLEREPKESILSRFDITVIGRYFPEYQKEISRRL